MKIHSKLTNFTFQKSNLDYIPILSTIKGIQRVYQNAKKLRSEKKILKINQNHPPKKKIYEPDEISRCRAQIWRGIAESFPIIGNIIVLSLDKAKKNMENPPTIGSSGEKDPFDDDKFFDEDGKLKD